MSAELDEEVEETALESVAETPSEAEQHPAGRTGRPSSRRRSPFDANKVQLKGMIRRVWEERGDVVVRLELPYITVEHDARKGGEQEPVPFSIPLRFPEGQTHSGQLVSLMDGLALAASGELVSTVRVQGLDDFLFKAHRRNFYQDIPVDERDAWNKLRFRHAAAEILVEEARVLPSLKAEDKRPPFAEVSGFINDIDTSRRFGTRLRLLVYDRAAKVVEPAHDGQFARHKPHYVSVLLPKGDFDPLVAQLHRKDHIRVSGELVQRFYAQSLHDALMDALAIQLIERLPDHDAPEDIVIELTDHAIIPEALIRLNS